MIFTKLIVPNQFFLKSIFCNHFGRNGIPKVRADVVFQVRISFSGRLRTPGTPIRKILVHAGVLPYLVP